MEGGLRYFGLCAALAASITSAEPAEAQQVSIRGARDCGKWAVYRQTEPNSFTTAAVENWLTGFIGGLATGYNNEFWNRGGREISNAQVFIWMDNYCRENPLKDIVDGAMLLFNEVVAP